VNSNYQNPNGQKVESHPYGHENVHGQRIDLHEDEHEIEREFEQEQEQE
jgi:hypothetical protein